MAAALKEHASSSLQSINLSGNPIEDKGELFRFDTWFMYVVVTKMWIGERRLLLQIIITGL